MISEIYWGYLIMFIKRAVSFAAAFAAAAVMTFAASADDYGQAGISWMIKDEWEHRNAVGLEPFNETESNVVTCQFKDVNITGNGDYTVEFSGWCVPDETREFVEVGTLGLDMSIDFEEMSDCVVTLNDCTIDGVTYTFNEQPVLEENGDNHILKIKNAYGVNADTTPEMDAKPWNTADPIVINFTVSGLPEDKIADNPDEVVVSDYVAEEPKPAAESSSEDAAESVVSDSPEDSGEDDPSIVPIVVGVAAGVVVIAVVAAVIVVKKKK